MQLLIDRLASNALMNSSYYAKGALCFCLLTREAYKLFFSYWSSMPRIVHIFGL
jgi:hypothetical protein